MQDLILVQTQSFPDSMVKASFKNSFSSTFSGGEPLTSYHSNINSYCGIKDQLFGPFAFFSYVAEMLSHSAFQGQTKTGLPAVCVSSNLSAA